MSRLAAVDMVVRGVWAASALAFFGGAGLTWSLAASVEAVLLHGLAAFAVIATAGTLISRLLAGAAVAAGSAEPAPPAGVDIVLPAIDGPPDSDPEIETKRQTAASEEL